MFRTFRKKPRKEESNEALRPSLSLPSLPTSGVAWPEDLVDVRAIRNGQDSAQQQQQSPHGATKTSFQFSPSDRVPIPFHKPWPGGAPPSSPSTDNSHGPQGISALYMKGPPPSAFDNNKRHSVQSHGSRTRQMQKRAKVAPTFNLMVRFSRFCSVLCCVVLVAGMSFDRDASFLPTRQTKHTSERALN